MSNHDLHDSEDLDDMPAEVDFSKGVRGKHICPNRAGYRVSVINEDGSVDERHYILEEGAVLIAPDLRGKYPDSESVNKALRSLATRA